MTAKRDTMANKINLMGSEVEEGFKCKPKKLDPNKPIMHFKSHIFVCDDARCKKAHKDQDVANMLRDILKEIDLHKGKDRIKISRSGCFGACRFRGVANIYENTKNGGCLQNNNIWLKHTHLYTKEDWIELFEALRDNRELDSTKFEQIEMACYS